VALASAAAHNAFGEHVSAARSQPCYVDGTHPEASEGGVVNFLSAKYEIPEERIATLGDMRNDVLVFARSGLSIAMVQSGREVRAARGVERQDGLPSQSRDSSCGRHEMALTGEETG
jgi:hydroxymethylpyrimidine pyrophosphatase-like HAD family hydrolase